MDEWVYKVLVIAGAVLGLGFVGYLTSTILRESEGNQRMKSISNAIRQGAMAFLKREFRILSIFTIIVFIVLAVFKLWPVTLTLAGLGGFILSIGMAVDANVLIFERMKEEIRTGRTLGAAIEAGFNRAWNAIRDSNITTIIVCLILIWVGNSIVGGAPVAGFAVTLLIGVLVSMFSAIIVTRTLLRLFVGGPLSRRTHLFSVSVGKKNV